MKRPASVLFLGSPYWCRYLRDVLGQYAALRGYTSLQIARWPWSRRRRICLVGLGPADTWKRSALHFVARCLFRLRLIETPIVYWIGSDVQRLAPEMPEFDRYRHFAGSDWLAEEVSAQGYSCAELLFPVITDRHDVVPLPDAERLQILCYIPDGVHERHGGSEILDTASRCPSMDFHVIGGTGSWCDNAPLNLSFLGWVEDTPHWMVQSHVVLRRTAHDSFSAFVREGLLLGRHVVFTYSVPGAIHVRANDAVALESVLRELEGQLQRRELQPNIVPQSLRALLADTRAQAETLADGLR